MVLLDHLTRGRVMLGVGPGALATDALMLGIDPTTQRPRMDEAMGVIMRLLTETEPHHLRERLVHAARGAPAAAAVHAAAHADRRRGGGFALRHGAGGQVRRSACCRIAVPARQTRTLRDFWGIAGEDGGGARQDGGPRRVAPGACTSTSPRRASRRCADVRARPALLARLLREARWASRGRSRATRTRSSTGMTERHAWCIGTPDDLVATIHRLEEQQRRLRRPAGPGGRLGDARADACTATS